MLLDERDNFNPPPFDTKRLRHLICDYFNIDNELKVGSFYREHDKRKFAGLSKELYKGWLAVRAGDDIVKVRRLTDCTEATMDSYDEAIVEIFEQAGSMLARKVLALLRSIDKVSSMVT